MLERLIIVILIAVIGSLAYRVYTRKQLANVAQRLNSDPLLEGLNHNLPTIIYFTTANCVPCKTQQQPALERLKSLLEVQVLQIDASQNPDAAERWGVMTAPTTFVLDSHWQPKAVNYGVADEHKLLKQVNEATQVA